MAELLLQELEPEFISRPTTEDAGYDLLVGFSNRKGGINTFYVEVKATEKPPNGRFPITRHTFEKLVHSNIPSLLLVADVKQNQFYFGWLNSRRISGTASVSIPLITLDAQGIAALYTQLRDTDGSMSAAG